MTQTLHPIDVIGMGSSPSDLTKAQMEVIATADILMGAKRHLEALTETPCEKKETPKALNELVAFLKSHMAAKKIAVIASGDPLFFGVGSYLIKHLGPSAIRIHPNVTAVGAAFARLKIPWHDAHVVSFHGREMGEDRFGEFCGKEKIAIYTSPENHPGKIAHMLLSLGMTGFRMGVVERMGYPDETISWLDLKIAVASRFADPNMVILLKDQKSGASQESRFKLISGTPEEWFVHEAGLITKSEVRVVALSKLSLERDHIVWDLGAGCGSVAIEASRVVERGRIVAVEQKPERVAHIQENIRRFGVKNVTVVQATLPTGLDRLPRPHRIFIGGGGKTLSTIIDQAASFLLEDGLLVVNCVLLENMLEAVKTMEKNGFCVDLVQIQVSRSRKVAEGRMLKSENPVFVITGKKEKESQP